MKIDKYNLRFIGVIIGMFLLGLTLWYFDYHATGFAFTIMGLMFTVMFLHVASKPREYFLRDERSTHINEKAGYHTFIIVMVCMAIITVADWKIEIFYKDVGSSLYLIAMGSWSFLRRYYDKKGFEQNQ
jgi:uncharacterized membrane protein